MMLKAILLFGVCSCALTRYNITDEIVTVAWDDIEYTQKVLHGLGFFTRKNEKSEFYVFSEKLSFCLKYFENLTKLEIQYHL